MEIQTETFKTAFELITDGVLIVGSDDTIIYENEASRRLLGCPPGPEVRNLSIGERLALIRAEDADCSPISLDQLFGVRTSSGEAAVDRKLIIRRPDGLRIRISVSCAPVPDEEGRPIADVCILRRIEEQERDRRRLRRQDRELRALSEHSPDLIVRFDRNRRRIYLNRAVELVTGIPREELTGTRLGEPEREERGILARLIEEKLPRVFEKGTEDTLEHPYETPGGLRHFHTRIVPEFADDGTVESVLTISRDITSLKLIEDRLEQEREAAETERRRLQAVLDALPVAVYITEAEGRLISANPAADEIWGITPLSDTPESYGRDYRAYWPADGRRVESREWGMARALSTGEQVVAEEMEIERFDGERRTILNYAMPIRDGRGTITGGVAVNVDITDRRRAEELLRRSMREAEEGRRTLETLMDYVPVGIAISGGPPDFRVERISRFGLDFTGRNPGTLMHLSTGMHQEAWGILLPDGRMPEQEDMPLFRASRLGETTLNRELLIKAADGTMRPVLVSAAPIRTTDGSIVAAINCWMDITDRKQAEEDLRKAMEIAQSANLAKSEFLANMSHDIRTPISGILGMIELLSSKARDEESREYLSMMRDSARSLLSILGDILDISRIESGREVLSPQTFPLREELERLVVPFSLLARERGLFFRTDFGPELPDTVYADPDKLRRVLRNLISNAVKYTERGGVAVAARVRETEDRRMIVCFSVADTGIGIPEKRQEELFRSFTRLHGTSTQRTVEGTGLGLAISRRLSDMMGGTIEVDSESEKGSTFSFIVPLELPPEPAGESCSLDSADDLERLPPLHILLAEDNRVNRVFVETLLSSAGHRVFSVENGREALEAASRESYDIVLMDVQMPVMDGLEATKRIRELPKYRHGIPIIALTAFAMSEDRERLLAAGMDGYVTKPLDPARLAGEILRVSAEM